MKYSGLIALQTNFLLSFRRWRCGGSDELWTCMADVDILLPCFGSAIPGDRVGHGRLNEGLARIITDLRLFHTIWFCHS